MFLPIINITIFNCFEFVFFPVLSVDWFENEKINFKKKTLTTGLKNLTRRMSIEISIVQVNIQYFEVMELNWIEFTV